MTPVVIMPRHEEKKPGKESHFELSVDTLAQLVFEHAVKTGKLPATKHSIELQFHADQDASEAGTRVRITGATFVACEQN
jgi:hypothetical protein